MLQTLSITHAVEIVHKYGQQNKKYSDQEYDIKFTNHFTNRFELSSLTCTPTPAKRIARTTTNKNSNNRSPSPETKGKDINSHK
jgi:hypothetical protein